jgi:hypothetical protein
MRVAAKHSDQPRAALREIGGEVWTDEKEKGR